MAVIKCNRLVVVVKRGMCVRACDKRTVCSHSCLHNERRQKGSALVHVQHMSALVLHVICALVYLLYKDSLVYWLYKDFSEFMRSHLG